MLAIRSPHLTYHFAPIVVAAAWPIVGQRVVAAIGGVAVALATTIVLGLTDRLQGPDLVGGSAAIGEAVLFAFAAGAGAALWVVVAARATPAPAE